MFMFIRSFIFILPISNLTEIYPFKKYSINTGFLVIKVYMDQSLHSVDYLCVRLSSVESNAKTLLKKSGRGLPWWYSG